MKLNMAVVLHDLRGKPMMETTTDTDAGPGCKWVDRLIDDEVPADDLPEGYRTQTVRLPSGEFARRFVRQKPMTLQSISEQALMTIVEGDAKLEAKEKARLTRITLRVVEAEQSGSCDLDNEDITLLKKRINDVFPQHVIVTRAHDAIESGVNQNAAGPSTAGQQPAADTTAGAGSAAAG